MMMRTVGWFVVVVSGGRLMGTGTFFWSNGRGWSVELSDDQASMKRKIRSKWGHPLVSSNRRSLLLSVLLFLP